MTSTLNFRKLVHTGFSDNEEIESSETLSSYLLRDFFKVKQVVLKSYIKLTVQLKAVILLVVQFCRIHVNQKMLSKISQEESTEQYTEEVGNVQADNKISYIVVDDILINTINKINPENTDVLLPLLVNHNVAEYQLKYLIALAHG